LAARTHPSPARAGKTPAERVRPMLKPQLAAALARSLDALGARSKAVPTIRAELERAYTEPQRHYHTLDHVEQCLAWLDWCWALAAEPHELAIALWFHDAIYDPRSAANEARSAAYARTSLMVAGVPEARIERIEAMIVATGEHASAEADLGLLVDIDLAILGASPEAFARFEQQIRAEYAHVSSADYARGRSQVLRQLGARDPLYVTPFMRGELEDQARRNLHQALQQLAVAP
jgi:predicted metal-dependent HD superfamily phosphohydrolase